MRKNYWVVDLYRKERFGSFPNKKQAAKVRTIVRVISDFGLEIASNVFVLGEHENKWWPVLHGTNVAEFPIGDIDNVKQQNANL